ncbi:MAG: phospholipase D family protein [Nitrospinae bacterium]|nr:phospholipase D family protein [Nitrospinota bacterium]
MRQQRSLSRGRLSLAAAFALVAVLAQPGLADVLSVYFGPRQSIDKPLIAIFDNAQRSIHVAMFSFTLDSYADALIRAHERGVEVKVVLDKGQARGRGSDARKLEAAGIPVRYGAGSGLMHHKFSIVDGRLVTTGSYNATWRGTHRNNENVVVIVDQKVARSFEDEFRFLWDESGRLQSKKDGGEAWMGR